MPTFCWPHLSPSQCVCALATGVGTARRAGVRKRLVGFVSRAAFACCQPGVGLPAQMKPRVHVPAGNKVAGACTTHSFAYEKSTRDWDAPSQGEERETDPHGPTAAAVIGAWEAGSPASRPGTSWPLGPNRQATSPLTPWGHNPSTIFFRLEQTLLLWMRKLLPLQDTHHVSFVQLQCWGDFDGVVRALCGSVSACARQRLQGVLVPPCLRLLEARTFHYPRNAHSTQIL